MKQSFFYILILMFIALPAVSYAKDEGENANSSESGSEPEVKSGTESENTTKTKEATQASEALVAPDLSSLVFYMEPSLNMSLGYELSDGDVHLILEMDHNPTLGQFIFGFHNFYPDHKVSNVIFENHQFGFNNKPVTLLPMIEVQNMGQDSVKFILGTQKFRTHQRINLSKILRYQSDRGLLLDQSGTRYKYDDILEIKIYASKPFNENRQSVRDYSYMSIPVQGVSANEVHQIYGHQVLADKQELTSYQIGDQIQLGPEFKIPYRSKNTQWIVRPELSQKDLLTYELVGNPQVGDTYTLLSQFIGFSKALPKLKKGFMWVILDEQEDFVTYIMAKEQPKLSTNIMLKYVQRMLMDLAPIHQNGEDLSQALANYLSHSPLPIRASRLTEVTEQILKLEDPQDILNFLNHEQYNYPIIESEIQFEAGQCQSFLN